MEVKLNRSVLVGDADVFPTRGGSVVDIEETKAREFIALGLAQEHTPAAAPVAAAPGDVKAAAVPENKMAKEPANKSAKK